MRATLTVQRHGGDTSRWEFDLSVDAPIMSPDFKEALVAEFVEGAPEAARFELTYGGTRDRPTFLLAEGPTSYFDSATKHRLD